MRKIITTALLTVFCLFPISLHTSYAAEVSSSAVNHISVGDIRIKLREYSRNPEGMQEPYQNMRVVLPSEKISKIPVIINEGMDAYIRCRITYDSTGKSLADENLQGIGEDWKKIGDYYYLTRILREGEKELLFEGVEVPSWWDSDDSGTEFSITIQAEAIQASNFSPDFQTENPWLDIPIQDCIHESGDKMIYERKNYRNLLIELDGSAKQILLIPSDFFANLDKGMPGDQVTDMIRIRNQSDRSSYLYFSTALPEGLEEKALKLLQRYQLTLRLGDQILYEGPLSAEKLGQELFLGKYDRGDSKELYFTLTLPEEIGNEFSLLDAAVIWKFRAVWEEGQPQSSSPQAGPSSPTDRYLGNLSIRTGLNQATMIRFALAALVCSLSLAASLIIRLRKRRSMHED